MARERVRLDEGDRLQAVGPRRRECVGPAVSAGETLTADSWIERLADWMGYVVCWCEPDDWAAVQIATIGYVP